MNADNTLENGDPKNDDNSPQTEGVDALGESSLQEKSQEDNSVTEDVDTLEESSLQEKPREDNSATEDVDTLEESSLQEKPREDNSATEDVDTLEESSLQEKPREDNSSIEDVDTLEGSSLQEKPREDNPVSENSSKYHTTFELPPGEISNLSLLEATNMQSLAPSNSSLAQVVHQGSMHRFRQSPERMISNRSMSPENLMTDFFQNNSLVRDSLWIPLHLQTTQRHAMPQSFWPTNALIPAHRYGTMAYDQYQTLFYEGLARGSSHFGTAHGYSIPGSSTSSRLSQTFSRQHVSAKSTAQESLNILPQNITMNQYVNSNQTSATQHSPISSFASSSQLPGVTNPYEYPSTSTMDRFKISVLVSPENGENSSSTIARNIPTVSCQQSMPTSKLSATKNTSLEHKYDSEPNLQPVTTPQVFDLFRSGEENIICKQESDHQSSQHVPQSISIINSISLPSFPSGIIPFLTELSSSNNQLADASVRVPENQFQNSQMPSQVTLLNFPLLSFHTEQPEHEGEEVSDIHCQKSQIQSLQNTNENLSSTDLLSASTNIQKNNFLFMPVQANEGVNIVQGQISQENSLVDLTRNASVSQLHIAAAEIHPSTLSVLPQQSETSSDTVETFHGQLTDSVLQNSHLLNSSSNAQFNTPQVPTNLTRPTEQGASGATGQLSSSESLSQYGSLSYLFNTLSNTQPSSYFDKEFVPFLSSELEVQNKHTNAAVEQPLSLSVMPHTPAGANLRHGQGDQSQSSQAEPENLSLKDFYALPPSVMSELPMHEEMSATQSPMQGCRYSQSEQGNMLSSLCNAPTNIQTTTPSCMPELPGLTREEVSSVLDHVQEFQYSQGEQHSILLSILTAPPIVQTTTSSVIPELPGRSRVGVRAIQGHMKEFQTSQVLRDSISLSRLLNAPLHAHHLNPQPSEYHHGLSPVRSSMPELPEGRKEERTISSPLNQVLCFEELSEDLLLEQGEHNMPPSTTKHRKPTDQGEKINKPGTSRDVQATITIPEVDEVSHSTGDVPRTRLPPECVERSPATSTTPNPRRRRSRGNLQVPTVDSSTEEVPPNITLIIRKRGRDD